ncbi:MAG: 4-hydroxy-3-methylbut-2-en-1-yl diphosphate synthase, partial [Bacteroidetes bacterium]
LNTLEVTIGDLKMGGQHPIRIQSMTTADTMNTTAVTEECIRLIQAGCEMIRITAPSIKEAENLSNIKKELKKRGYQIPLCADIHYTPNAAEVAARIVEKVRINPGNYADKKKFEFKEYSDTEYDAELERIREKFLPLIKVCKEYGTAMRIGTNHGSLSDRILSRYGDTPLGMVESAMEFIRICEEENFRNIVISMKASNPLVMIDAYRLLVKTMIERGTLYPLHLGVTEAGDGEDGRIKSAIGIGTLLEDGIGDTVRVSLTEPAENEIPAAKKLAKPYNDFLEKNKATMHEWLLNSHPKWIHPHYLSSQENDTQARHEHFRHEHPVVVNTLDYDEIKPAHFFSAGYIYNVSSDKWHLNDFACDYIYVKNKSVPFEIPGNLGIIQDFEQWRKEQKPQHYPLVHLNEIQTASSFKPEKIFISIENIEDCKTIQELSHSQLVAILSLKNSFYEAGRVVHTLQKINFSKPLILKFVASPDKDEETLIIDISRIAGYIMTAGYGNGLMIQNAKSSKALSLQKINSLMFNILQGLRKRISKTEYIACPSCGRTLFDLQQTTQKIKEKTSHLKGVKIGIMGCIVNGPGEMADADFGYVGTGPGKVSLYKGHTVVKKNVPEEKAVEELINLIKEYDRWIDPPSVN